MAETKISEPVPFSEKILVAVILSLSFILWTVIAYLSEGSPEGGDAYIHYKFARYAFLYPELLLDHWGKPLYTALAAPFSQLGYFGAQLFNILLGTASAYLAWRISVELNLNHRPLVIILILFIPYYSIVMLSALTEVLFSFVLTLAVFLFLKKRYLLTAIVISFIPFVRTEGFGMIVVFLVLLLFKREWKTLPYLLTGTLFYSIIGFFHFHDLFWVFTHTPYSQTGSELYGSGVLFYYFVEGKDIFGKSMMYIVGFGSLVMLYRLVVSFIKTRHITENSEFVHFILIFGIFYGYIFVQSFLWYFGLMGVLGSYRFMVCIMPLAGIIALYGISIAPQKLFNRSLHIPVLYLLVGFFIISVPFKFYKFPWKHSPPQQVAENAAQWIQEVGLTKEKIWYYDPSFFMLLDLNPYDYSKSQEFPSSELNPELQMHPGDLIIWDAHFGPNEGKTPLDRLFSSDQLIHLKVFLPEEPFMVLGRNYEIHVFQKAKNPVYYAVFENKLFLLGQQSEMEPDSSWQLVYFNSFSQDFANKPDTLFWEMDSDDQAFVMSPDFEYFGLFEDSLSRFIINEREMFFFSVEVDPINFNSAQENIYLVVTTENQAGLVTYKTIGLNSKIDQAESWIRIYHSFEIEQTENSPDLILKIFIWYKGEGEILIDNPLLMKANR